MKLLPLAVAVAVVSITGLTIWVGARAREETVVERPYEEGLRYDEDRRARLRGHDHGRAHERAEPCDLAAGPCTTALGDLTLVAEIGPRPLATLRLLRVTVELRRDGAPIDGAAATVSFAMPGMDMGENEVALAPAGAGRYVGSAVLVRCPSGRRGWTAAFEVRTGGGAVQRAELALRLEE